MLIKITPTNNPRIVIPNPLIFPFESKPIREINPKITMPTIIDYYKENVIGTEIISEINIFFEGKIELLSPGRYFHILLTLPLEIHHMQN